MAIAIVISSAIAIRPTIVIANVIVAIIAQSLLLWLMLLLLSYCSAITCVDSSSSS